MKRMQRVFGNLDALRYADNRLDDERKAAYLAHLADDPHEAERVATWSRQNDVIRATYASIAVEPVPLWLRLGSVTDRPSAVRDPQPLPPPDRRARPGGEARVADIRRLPRLAEVPVGPLPVARRHRTTSIGISAVVLLAIGVFVLVAAHMLLPTPAGSDEGVARVEQQGIGALVSRAADAYRTYARDPVRPVEMSAAQQPALDRWLQRRLAFFVQAPDLRADGWTLLGGRLVPGDLGPSAFYVFESATGDRMAVYIGRSAATPSSALALDPIAGGGSAMSWVASQVGYVLTVDKSLDWLSRNAETLRTHVMRPAP